MKKFLLLLSLFTFLKGTAQQSDPQTVLEQIISHAREASLYRNTVGWDTLQPMLMELGKQATSIDEITPIVNRLFAVLGDEHARLYHQRRVVSYYSSGKPKPQLKDYDGDLYNKIQMGQTYAFHAELLADGVGYLRIVGMPTGDNEKMAFDIKSKVCELMAQGAQKWILDLRYNGGGNMHPMAEGVAPLLGDGEVGGSSGLTPEETMNWRVENGNFYFEDYSIGLDTRCTPAKLATVAVLTSLYTVSSGEALAVCFKQRPNTRFFGNDTGGMVTTTDYTPLGEATFLTIGVSYYMDRKKQIYKEFVPVDEAYPFVEQPLGDNDTTVKAALQWLKAY